MGILVNNGVLPSGVNIHNAYLTLRNSTVSVKLNQLKECYDVFAYCDVLKEYNASNITDLRFIVYIEVKEDSITSVYKAIYSELKKMFPDSVDDL